MRPWLPALALPAVTLIATSPALAWRSTLYPADWTPATTDAQGRFLHDFSQAGYHAGADPLPDAPPGVEVDVTAPPYGADATGSVDATAALQAAIDDVAAAGGGVVHLPAGTYRVAPPAGREAALIVTGSSVVLRGDGSDATFLLNTETSMRNRRILLVRPDRDAHVSWYWEARDEHLLAADARARDGAVALADVGDLAAGDEIVVRADPTEAWIDEHGMGGVWDAAQIAGPIYYRRIVAVDPVARTIELDVPLRGALSTRDAARVNRLRAPLREVGIEHLAIGNVQNRAAGRGDDDYDREGTGAWEMHASFAIYLDHVIDSWVRDVRSFAADGNDPQVHLLSDGLRTDASRFVTVADVDLRYPEYQGEGGNGDLFVFSGSECLVTRATAVGGRHNYSFGLMQTTGNVLHDSSSTDARLPSDFHMHLSAANLIDGLRLDGDFVEARRRACCGHGHSTTQSVIWNAEGIDYPSDQIWDHYIVDSAQFGDGYVIGTRGAAPSVRTPGDEGTAPTDWVEGEGDGEALEPVSLYEDQRARRYGVVETPGEDAGPVAPDAGPDPGRDASVAPPGRDAGAEPGLDAAADPGGGTSGYAADCGCRLVAARDPVPRGLLLVLVASVAARRRRARRSGGRHPRFDASERSTSETLSPRRRA